MSKQEEKIRTAFNQLGKSPSSFISATVKMVDQTKMTCECVDTLGNKRINVRLRANIDTAEGFILIPTTESSVQLGRLADEQFFVNMVSNVEKVLLIINGKVSCSIDEKTLKAEHSEHSLEMNSEGIKLNGGKLGGLVKVKELKSNLEKLTARVDAIFDGLKNLTPDAPQAGSASVTAGLKAIVSPSVEDFSKIENEKVKH